MCMVSNDLFCFKMKRALHVDVPTSRVGDKVAVALIDFSVDDREGLVLRPFKLEGLCDVGDRVYLEFDGAGL